MRLTVVGCSGSIPGPASAASCYLVEHDDESGRTWRVLLDLGSGALGPLQDHCDPRDLDAVLLSHLHPDHCLDVTGLHVLLHYHPDGPVPGGVLVAGPAGVEQRLLNAHDPEPGLGIRPGGVPMGAHLDFVEWQPGVPVTIGPLTVTPIRVDHPVEAYGLRIEAGRAVLAYSGDTGPCDGLQAVARDADVFLCEAAFTPADGDVSGVHLTGHEAGEAAAKAAVARLVVTHVPPWHSPDAAAAEAAAVFGGEVQAARPGLVIEIG